MPKYMVLRPLEGDKSYKPGESREMSPAAAKRLVDLKCLRLWTEEDDKALAKAKAKPKTKPKTKPAQKPKTKPEPPPPGTKDAEVSTDASSAEANAPDDNAAGNETEGEQQSLLDATQTNNEGDEA